MHSGEHIDPPTPLREKSRKEWAESRCYATSSRLFHIQARCHFDSNQFKNVYSVSFFVCLFFFRLQYILETNTRSAPLDSAFEARLASTGIQSSIFARSSNERRLKLSRWIVCFDICLVPYVLWSVRWRKGGGF